MSEGKDKFFWLGMAVLFFICIVSFTLYGEKDPVYWANPNGYLNNTTWINNTGGEGVTNVSYVAGVNDSYGIYFNETDMVVGYIEGLI